MSRSIVLGSYSSATCDKGLAVYRTSARDYHTLLAAVGELWELVTDGFNFKKAKSNRNLKYHIAKSRKEENIDQMQISRQDETAREII